MVVAKTTMGCCIEFRTVYQKNQCSNNRPSYRKLAHYRLEKRIALVETSPRNSPSKTEYPASDCWYSYWYQLSRLTLLLRRRRGISRRPNCKTYTFGLDLYRKSRRQDQELCTDKLYPCLFHSWRGKVGGNWFNSTPILGNRSCSQRRTSLGVEDRTVLDNTQKSLKFVEGRYQVAIPWKKNTTLPQNNYEMALRRLEGTEHRLLKSPEIARAYTDCIEKYTLKGYISKVPREDRPAAKWFLPHFPIVRPDRTTTKTRNFSMPLCGIKEFL